MLKRFVQILAVAGLAAGLVSGPAWACDKHANDEKAANAAEAKSGKDCCAKKADGAVAEKAGCAKAEGAAAANGASGCAKSGAGCPKAAKATVAAKKADKPAEDLAAKDTSKTSGTN